MAAMAAAQGPAQLTTTAGGDRAARGGDFKTSVAARDAGHGGVLPQRGAVIGGPGHEANHGAVGIDETVGRAEAAAEDVIGAELREQAADLVAGDEAHVLQSHRNLLFEIGAQVGQVFFAGRAEEVSLGAVVARVAEALFETGIEGDGVERHLDVDRRRELSADAAHALAGGSLALGVLALDDEDVLAAGGDEVAGDAGADNASADEDDVCGVHGAG